MIKQATASAAAAAIAKASRLTVRRRSRPVLVMTTWGA
jgi:hypothetical protein